MQDAKQPSDQAIRAALNACYSAIARSPDTTDGVLKITQLNADLHREAINLAAGFAAGQTDDPNDWKRLSITGKLNRDLLAKVHHLCDLFFWVGWHARGATEQEAKEC